MNKSCLSNECQRINFHFSILQVVLNSNRSFDSMFMVHAGHTAAYHLDPRQVSGTGSYASIVTLHDENLAKKGLSFGQEDNTQNPLPSSFK